MNKPEKGASEEELQKYIESLEAENTRLKTGGAAQERLNNGKVLTVTETDEEDNPFFEVDYQFTRQRFVWPKFGEVTASDVISNPEKYGTYIQRMIKGGSELLVEVARRDLSEAIYEQYDDVTIKEMKAALDAAQKDYDGTHNRRAYYLPLYHELQQGGEG